MDKEVLTSDVLFDLICLIMERSEVYATGGKFMGYAYLIDGEFSYAPAQGYTDIDLMSAHDYDLIY